jgi:hypothetical protein
LSFLSGISSLRRLRFQSAHETWESYKAGFARMGGVVETVVEGDRKRSPSCQACISPQGEVEILSTHEQVLGGPDGQDFLGCAFPADDLYSLALIDATQRVGAALARRGAAGRFAVDFMVVEQKAAPGRSRPSRSTSAPAAPRTPPIHSNDSAAACSTRVTTP